MPFDLSASNFVFIALASSHINARSFTAFSHRDSAYTSSHVLVGIRKQCQRLRSNQLTYSYFQHGASIGCVYMESFMLHVATG